MTPGLVLTSSGNDRPMNKEKPNTMQYLDGVISTNWRFDNPTDTTKPVELEDGITKANLKYQCKALFSWSLFIVPYCTGHIRNAIPSRSAQNLLITDWKFVS